MENALKFIDFSYKKQITDVAHLILNSLTNFDILGNKIWWVDQISL